MNRLVDPPRAVPRGLVLKVLADSGAPSSLFWFVPAAATLVIVAMRSRMDISLQALLVFFGLVMVGLGFIAALPDLYRGLAALRRMRTGVETTGRIVACRLAWDGKGNDVPYRAFLEDWLVQTTQSQMGKATGCLIKMFVVVLGFPMLIVVLLLAVAAVMNFPMLAAGGTMGGVTLRDVGAFIGMAVLGSILTAVMMYFLRRDTLDTARDYIEWARKQPSHAGGHDPATIALLASAREQAQDLQLKDPLPKDGTGVDLICRVEYSVMGELRTASARARFSDRLDLAGVERLLFNPLDQGKVTLFVGLPAEARSDELGQWRDVPSAVTGTKLALVAAVAMVATAALLRNAFVLYTHFQP